MKISPLDSVYQQAVNEHARLFLTLDEAAIMASSDFGSFAVLINDQLIEGGRWHYRYGETHHVVFKLSRKLGLGFYRQYLSGVKYVQNTGSQVSLLSDEELGNYD